MLKEHDGPKEPAEKRASRKWGNNALSKKIKASKVPAPVVVDPNAPPEIASVLKTERPKADIITKFENSFKRDIREIMKQHKHSNIEIQLALMRHERRKLLIEKCRRRGISIKRDENAEAGIAEYEGNTK